MKQLALLFTAFFLLLSYSSAQNVSTQFGPVSGVINNGIYQFLGIPFAKPPVGNLRWKAPENPENWTNVLNTTVFSPVCTQKKYEQGSSVGTIIGEEDCLYLNVWSPQIGNSNLPVMVFIHGGGNKQGSASEVNGGTEMFFGKNLSEKGNAVVVTIQYRLGPLGFLVHPGLESENANGVAGNYAVMDQILALTWVKNNIVNFGGDPNKVMIFGESAGGLNVGNLLLTPLANGLFQRAGIQSAVPVLGDYNVNLANGYAYVDSFIASGTNAQKINFMRSLPSDSLVKFEEPALSGGMVSASWQSVIDGVVFFDTPLNTIQTGNFNHVPLLIGSNSEEMSISAPPTVYPFMVTVLINSFVPASLQAQATTLYPPGNNNTEARASYVGILTDVQFTSTTRRIAQCVSQNQNEPVYRYFFTHKHTIPQLAAFGSYHGMELFYIFNTWEDATLGTGPLFSAQDDSVQTAMARYWSNFAASGNPNQATLPTWPTYQSSTDNYLEIKATPNGNQLGIRTAKSDLWDDVIGFTACTSTATLNENEMSSIVLFPNPSNGNIQIQIPTDLMNYEVNIYNQLGQLILSKKNTPTFDLSEKDGGIYVVEILFEDKKWVGRFIKSYL